MAILAPDRRIHGLDTLRACAIVLVLLHHYRLFVHGGVGFGALGEVGWIGVDLFFALSGYLIGNQIFSAMRSEAGFSVSGFYLRRALRTLPNFWVVLALYWLWPALREGAPAAPLWRYLSFTLNIGLVPPAAFSHAWSLCIEEQFYLLLPALAMLAWASRMPRRAAWSLLALTVAGSALARAAGWDAWHAGGAADVRGYFEGVYYASLCRLDELVAGVALALLKNCHPAAWQRATRHGVAWLAGGAALCALAIAMFLHDRFGLPATLVGFPVLGLGFGMLLLSALSERGPLARVKVPGARSLALWSYAIYLTHRIVFTVTADLLKQRGVAPDSVGATVIMMALAVLAGWLLYRVVETPFMALRARWAPPAALPAAAR
ncbi:MAG: acyltransferase [Massilia sp.]